MVGNIADMDAELYSQESRRGRTAPRGRPLDSLKDHHDLSHSGRSGRKERQKIQQVVGNHLLRHPDHAEPGRCSLISRAFQTRIRDEFEARA